LKEAEKLQYPVYLSSNFLEQTFILRYSNFFLFPLGGVAYLQPDDVTQELSEHVTCPYAVSDSNSR
jgi:hypothetical protein